MKKKIKKYYDFDKMVEKVEKKYNFKYRDYHNKWYNIPLDQNIWEINGIHKDTWEKIHYPIIIEWEKNPAKDSRFNKIGNSFYDSLEGKKFWEKLEDEYAKDPNGKAKEYMYMDLWHFILNNFEIDNGCFISINWKELLNVAERDWQKQALQFFVDEYGDKYYEVKVSW